MCITVGVACEISWEIPELTCLTWHEFVYLNLHSKTWKRNMKVSHRAQGFRPVSKFSHPRGSKEHNNTVTLHSVKDVLKFLEGKISLLSCD